MGPLRDSPEEFDQALDPRQAVMTPPVWRDDDGRDLPTRPCPQCGRVIPIHTRWWPTAGGVKHEPFEVFDYVEWCGHRQEVILVPRDDGWWGEIPVLGEAS